MSEAANYADLVKRATGYLANGGLFNPELMEHEKVRDLIKDMRAAIEALVRERDDADMHCNAMLSYCAASGDEPDLLLSSWRAAVARAEIAENGNEALMEALVELPGQVLERAAKVAEDVSRTIARDAFVMSGPQITGQQIAAAIRALKGKS